MPNIALFGKGLLLISVWTLASTLNIGDSCSPNPSVQIHEKGPCQNYTLACDPTNNLCTLKGCKFNESPLGWPMEWQTPASCNTESEYCPDDQLKCMPKIKIGDICSSGRDDSCAEKASVCLSQRCVLKNIQLNQPCSLDNVTLLGINRDNCEKGTFCNNPTLQCITSYKNGEKCTEDRQCLSNTCNDRKKICTDAEDYNHFPIWAYVLIGLGIVSSIFTIILLVYLRKRRRAKRSHQPESTPPTETKSPDNPNSYDPNEFVTIIPEPPVKT